MYWMIDVLIDSDGREELIKKLTGYNKELYTDARQVHITEDIMKISSETKCCRQV